MAIDTLSRGLVNFRRDMAIAEVMSAPPVLAGAVATRTFWLTAARSALASSSRRGSTDRLAGYHVKRGVQVRNQVRQGVGGHFGYLLVSRLLFRHSGHASVHAGPSG